MALAAWPPSPDAATGGWPLYSAAAIQTLDRLAIETGVSGFSLMQAAARQAWQLAQRHWPSCQRLAVICGTGKNGGDALMLAVFAQRAGVEVDLYLAQPMQLQIEEVALAWQAIQEAGLKPQLLAAQEVDLAGYDLVVDGLLGVGLQAALRPPYAEWIERINLSGCPVLALDLPSGLNANTGQPSPIAVVADLTLTFIGWKLGLFTGRGRDYVGALFLADLGVPARVTSPPAPLAELRGKMPALQRPASAHKGQQGKVLILGGVMAGAAILSAQAALRAGAGRVRLLMPPEAVSSVLLAQPELMVQSWTLGDEAGLVAALNWCEVLVIGPGLGQDARSRALFQAALAWSGPRVMDADALNLLAQLGGLLDAQTVITPHPAEAARLLSCHVEQIEQDRLAAVKQLAQQTQAQVVLKGSGSLIAGAQSGVPDLCPFGNSGMAVAGMGDLLTGCIAALMAQGRTPYEAACQGVLLHARAGDQAAGASPIGLLPSDLLKYIRQGVNGL
ncbi:NAD(P)H-hydrate dehydratase [Marinospirillum sp.]|uniref:NAD(P)H-hydrate dehydratase n=1 Tax=Marinospirillum sp. TaxID=2183934 RepID=UPI003A8BD122